MAKILLNFLMLFFIYPTFSWIAITIYAHSSALETAHHIFSTLWAVPLKLYIPFALMLFMTLKVSDHLNMGLRQHNEYGATYIGIFNHAKTHSSFKTFFQKIVSLYILANSVLAPFFAGWAFWGGIIWYFAEHTY